MNEIKILWNALVNVWITVRDIQAPNRRLACQMALTGAPPRAIVMECWPAEPGVWHVTYKAMITVRDIVAETRKDACLRAVEHVEGNAMVEHCWKADHDSHDSGINKMHSKEKFRAPAGTDFSDASPPTSVGARRAVPAQKTSSPLAGEGRGGG